MASAAAGPRINFPFREAGVLSGHTGAVLTVRFNHDGSYCLSGGRDRCVKLWNPHKHTCVHTYSGVHGYEVRGVCIAHDNAQFASCGGDRQAFIWDVLTAKVIRRVRGHTQRVNTLSFNHNAQVLVTGSYDGTVACWDCRANTRDAIQVLRDFKDSVTSLVVHDSEIIAGSVDGCVRHYDIRNGRLTTDHICQAITSTRVSKDGHCVLVSCVDSTVRLMDRATGGLLQEYTAHTHKDVTLESCFTNDDAYVISSSEDRKIYIWSLVDGALCHTIDSGGVAVSLDYHPNEVCMLSAEQANIRVWR